MVGSFCRGTVKGNCRGQNKKCNNRKGAWATSEKKEDQKSMNWLFYYSCQYTLCYSSCWSFWLLCSCGVMLFVLLHEGASKRISSRSYIYFEMNISTCLFFLLLATRKAFIPVVHIIYILLDCLWTSVLVMSSSCSFSMFSPWNNSLIFFSKRKIWLT